MTRVVYRFAFLFSASLICRLSIFSEGYKNQSRRLNNELGHWQCKKQIFSYGQQTSFHRRKVYHYVIVVQPIKGTLHQTDVQNLSLFRFHHHEIFSCKCRRIPDKTNIKQHKNYVTTPCNFFFDLN